MLATIETVDSHGNGGVAPFSSVNFLSRRLATSVNFSSSSDVFSFSFCSRDSQSTAKCCSCLSIVSSCSLFLTSSFFSIASHAAVNFSSSCAFSS